MAKKKVKKENSERWLLTYSDLITLLMIFFVVMYSISSVDSKKYNELAGSLSNTMGIFEGGSGGSNNINTTPSINTTTSSSAMPPLSSHKEIEQKLQEYIENHELADEVSVHVEPEGLILSFNESILFDSGKAVIQKEQEKHLLEICTILKTFDNNVVIEGHTDNVPIHNAQFHSNWELAATRAINIVHYFIDEGDFPPSKLSAVSYGEYRPVASNDTPEGRAKNRRIDIVLLSTTFYEENQTSSPEQ